MLKLTLSTLLTGLIVYLVYLEISENPLPNALHDVMQNEYSRMALLASIPLEHLPALKTIEETEFFQV